MTYHASRKTCVTLVILLWTASAAPAQPLPFEPGRDVTFEQHLNRQLADDLELRDEQGEPVILAELQRGRPMVLMLVQYRCPMLCDLALAGLVRSLKTLSLDPGRQFEIAIVSFDPREGAELAAAKKNSVVEEYGRPAAKSGWHFLTGTKPVIDRLCETVGFRYFYDAEQDQYAHPAGVVVLTPDRRVSKYFPGIDPPARDLRLGLVEASEGQIGTLSDRVLLLCYHYDPATGRYGFVVINLIRVLGGLTVVGLAGAIGVMLRRERKRDRA